MAAWPDFFICRLSKNWVPLRVSLLLYKCMKLAIFGAKQVSCLYACRHKSFNVFVLDCSLNRPRLSSQAGSKSSCYWWISQRDMLTSTTASNSYCAGCDRPINDRFLLSVVGQSWHIGCLRCAQCGLVMTDTCFVRNGKLYCQQHFKLGYVSTQIAIVMLADMISGLSNIAVFVEKQANM